ncbi:hypothetical protein TEQG_00417 [Trichophyton equinum CBS 127.97]|uniref:Uncharacterized protein n=1 Tax=Trichophyton equinum (strain ATCC MYA-4606 / CBS 127.97) TaxID=559882 RepID=F2PHJ7_TRIEC|nr:hypothetical protein TEQG_00417 [Trichophyton equinum CBS 127.97]
MLSRRTQETVARSHGGLRNISCDLISSQHKFQNRPEILPALRISLKYQYSHFEGKEDNKTLGPLGCLTGPDTPSNLESYFHHGGREAAIAKYTDSLFAAHWAYSQQANLVVDWRP